MQLRLLGRSLATDLLVNHRTHVRLTCLARRGIPHQRIVPRIRHRRRCSRRSLGGGTLAMGASPPMPYAMRASEVQRPKRGDRHHRQTRHNGSTTRPRPNRRQHHRQPPTTEAQLAPAPHVGSTTARPRTTCVVSRSAASPLPAKRSDATQVVRGRRRGTNAGGPGPETWH